MLWGRGGVLHIYIIQVTIGITIDISIFHGVGDIPALPCVQTDELPLIPTVLHDRRIAGGVPGAVLSVEIGFDDPGGKPQLPETMLLLGQQANLTPERPAEAVHVPELLDASALQRPGL